MEKKVFFFAHADKIKLSNRRRNCLGLYPRFFHEIHALFLVLWFTQIPESVKTIKEGVKKRVYVKQRRKITASQC